MCYQKKYLLRTTALHSFCCLKMLFIVTENNTELPT